MPLDMTTHEIQIGLVRGHNDEIIEAFAHAHDGKGAALLSRVSRDGRRPQSIASRINVGSMRGRLSRKRPVACSSEAFHSARRLIMRIALGDALRQAWPNCVHAAAPLGAIIDLDDEGRGAHPLAHPDTT